MALTETWLGEHRDAELKIENYTLFRKDRERQRCRRGRDSGGVAIYMRDDLAADMDTVISFSNSVIETLGLYSKTNNLLIIVVYRQPDDIGGGHRSTDVEFKQALSKLEETLSSINSPMPDILICGDFNLPHAEWKEGQIGNGANKDEKLMIEDLLSLKNEFFLTQIIQEPTHKQGNMLDLCFTNNPMILHTCNMMETILSDHKIIECLTTYSTMSPKGEKPITQGNSDIEFDKLNFFSEDTDWANLEKELREYNWEADFRGSNPQYMLSKFVEACKIISARHVPARKARGETQAKNHIPRDRRNLMRNRRRIKTQLRKTTSETKRKKLNQLANQVEKELMKSYRRSQEDSETKAVNAIKRNAKYFFSYAKKFCTVKSAIGPFINSAKNIVTCPVAMAKMLAEQYISVYSTPKEQLPVAKDIFTDTPHGNHWLHNISFDQDDIIEAIDEISPTAAAGPDRFPALLLKMCKQSLARPLFLIWRKSLDTGEIPFILKTANVVPIHKGGSRGAPENYRPVALTSHLIKFFERVLRKHIVSYMDENGLFNQGQHGFRHGRSCLSQLIAHFDHITQLLEKGQNVDVVYLDFAKAFDKVDYSMTMKKLQSIGISGKLGRWIYTFLTDRKQAVLVNGEKGTPFDVLSGVPQGSVLGPLLFLVLISDIDSNITSAFLSSFADDTRVAKGIISEDDVIALQSDLQAIYRWAEENNMEFNSPKFECLRYGNNSGIKENSSYTTPTGDPIKIVESAKDLGITMSSSGTFRKQISNVTNTASQLCGWVLRTFKTRQRIPMLMLWRSLIRPKLEYCCQLWSPTQKGDIQNLEQVQRSFIRKIAGVQQLSYWQQLRELSMYSLERRRERYMILYVWRIMENQAPNFSHPDEGGIQSAWHPRRGRNCIIPTFNLRGPKQFQNVRDKSFGITGPRLFNILPAYIRNISGCTINTFKNRLDKFLATVPDEPQIRGYTAMRRADTNSLVNMVQHAEAH